MGRPPSLARLLAGDGHGQPPSRSQRNSSPSEARNGRPVRERPQRGSRLGRSLTVRVRHRSGPAPTTRWLAADLGPGRPLGVSLSCVGPRLVVQTAPTEGLVPTDAPWTGPLPLGAGLRLEEILFSGTWQPPRLFQALRAQGPH